jgi:polyhydroxybutyrate depolymerase
MRSITAALVLSGVLTSAIAAITPGDHRIAVMFGDLQRSYIVHVPAGAAAGAPLPVVINLHGGGSNAEGQQKYSGMDRVADRERFLVVYPDGTGRLPRMLTWNAGTCCAGAALQQVDDVGFIRAVVADLSTRTPVDRSRIFATGLSNGAMMAYRLAAEAPDLVAAIAPVAGSMVIVRFHPTLPVSIMHIHSVDDPRALYNGGLGPPFPMTATRVEHPPVEQQLAKWIAFDRCPSSPAVAMRLTGNRGSADEGNTATKLLYAPCAAGTQIVLWKLSGSGHVWPGSISSYERLLGRPTHLIDANEEIWSFFKTAPPRMQSKK